jgi:hexosaminidase
VEPIQFSESAGIDQKDRVLGGEVAAWGERIDATNSISTTWPLAAAVGERLWSPATVTDEEDAERRMFRIRCRMLARGIQASPTMPMECPLIFDTKEDKYKDDSMYHIAEQ